MTKLIDVMGYVIHETDKAVFFSETGNSEDAVWLPKSQIEVHDLTGGDVVEVTLPEWLAKDKELI